MASQMRISKLIQKLHRKHEQADSAIRRSQLYRWAKQINRIERRHMKGGILEQLLGGAHTQHVTND